MRRKATLTIAGSDSGGGAGIQADIKSISAMGVYACSVVTALTAQNTREVRAIEAVSPRFIRDQIDAVCEDITIDSVKIGMLSEPSVIETVADGLERHGLRNIVLDPVMVAKSGDKLLQDSAIAVLKERLLPMATVITPNLPEAAVLIDSASVSDERQMRDAALALRALGAKAVLVKGGHLANASEAVDLLVTAADEHRFVSERFDTTNTHGTGCSLSSALAARLAVGDELPEAVATAKDWLSEAIRQASSLEIGQGHGPVHHFHRFWD